MQTDSNAADAMGNAILHRGPDGQGAYHGQFGFVGNQRLAIIDPKEGISLLYRMMAKWVLSKTARSSIISSSEQNTKSWDSDSKAAATPKSSWLDIYC